MAPGDPSEPYAPRSPDLSGLHHAAPPAQDYDPPPLPTLSQHHHQNSNSGAGAGADYGLPPSYGYAHPPQHVQGQMPGQVQYGDPYAGGAQYAPFAPTGAAQHAGPGFYAAPDPLSWPPQPPGPFPHPQAPHQHQHQHQHGFNTMPPSGGAASPEPTGPYPGEAHDPPINVRTKFPVARIKRIVQADEEVGKVAQVTPHVVSKALELFMIALTLESAEHAKRRGAKRVTAQDMRGAVQDPRNGQFDFLGDIVGRIPEGPAASAGAGQGAGGRKTKRESSEDEDEDEEEVKPRRRGRPAGTAGAGPSRRGRKRKSEED